MSSTYAGVTFTWLIAGEQFPPLWTRERRIMRHNPVNGSLDYLVDTGSGNYTISLTAKLTAVADADTLEAAVGVTAQELVLEGTTYSSTYLVAAGNRRKHLRASLWLLDLTFERTS